MSIFASFAWQNSVLVRIMFQNFQPIQEQNVDSYNSRVASLDSVSLTHLCDVDIVSFSSTWWPKDVGDALPDAPLFLYLGLGLFTAQTLVDIV